MGRFSIRNATKILQSASGVLFGRKTSGVGAGEELTAADVRTLLSVYTVSQTHAAISAAVAALVDSSPGTLDTLNELAAALGDDPNFATTVSAAIGAKYTLPGSGIPKSDLAAAVQTSLGLADTALQSVTNISGNAATATVLQTARTINGVSFNGSANITVTAAGSTLSDTVPVGKGGTGLTALGSALQVLRVNAGATALEYATASGIGGSTGATDRAILVANGTGGSTLQAGHSGVTIESTGSIKSYQASADAKVLLSHFVGAQQTAKIETTTGYDLQLCPTGAGNPLNLGILTTGGGSQDHDINLYGGGEYNTKKVKANSCVRIYGTGNGWATADTDVFLEVAKTKTSFTGGTNTYAKHSGTVFRTFSVIGQSGTHTVTDMATVQIDAAPTAGANAVLTNAWSLHVVAGASKFGGRITSDAGIACGSVTFAVLNATSATLGLGAYRVSDRSNRWAYPDGTNWRWFGDDAIIS